MISGCHCEVWEINHLTGNRLLAEVFVLNEHLPLELIYKLTISVRGICIQGKHSGWMFERQCEEEVVIDYLQAIQRIREEIYIEVCKPEPYLPGYPEIDYHPKVAPIVLMNDLPEDKRPEEPIYEPTYD